MAEVCALNPLNLVRPKGTREREKRIVTETVQHSLGIFSRLPLFRQNAIVPFRTAGPAAAPFLLAAEEE